MPLILELSELGSIYNRENELFPKLNFFTSEKTYIMSVSSEFIQWKEKYRKVKTCFVQQNRVLSSQVQKLELRLQRQKKRVNLTPPKI